MKSLPKLLPLLEHTKIEFFYLLLLYKTNMHSQSIRLKVDSTLNMELEILMKLLLITDFFDQVIKPIFHKILLYFYGLIVKYQLSMYTICSILH